MIAECGLLFKLQPDEAAGRVDIRDHKGRQLGAHRLWLPIDERLELVELAGHDSPHRGRSPSLPWPMLRGQTLCLSRLRCSVAPHEGTGMVTPRKLAVSLFSGRCSVVTWVWLDIEPVVALSADHF